MNDAAEAPPARFDLTPLALPAALAALTLGTVIAFDAHTMLLSVLLWCVVWVVALAPQRTVGWTAPAQRVVLATGLAWTALFVAMVVTRQSTDVGGGFYVTETGWPARIRLGVAPLAHAWQSNLAWLWSPAIDVAPPHVYESNRCAANLWAWGTAGALAVAWLPAHRLPRLLAVARTLAPLAGLASFASLPFHTMAF